MFSQFAFNVITNVIENTISNTIENGLKNVSTGCVSHINAVVNGAKQGEMWALKMLDATSKLQSGVLEGNIADFGSYEECLDVDAETVSGRVVGKYCLATWKPGNMLEEVGSNYGIDVSFIAAVCFPRTCNEDDMEEVLSMVPGVIFDVDELYCQESRKPPLDAGAICAILFMVIVLGMIAISSCYDYIVKKFQAKPSYPLLLSFSLFTNLPKLFKVTKGTDTLSSLHGIKALSMLWIIMAHDYLAPINVPLSNYFPLLKLREDPSAMVLESGSYSVDTFLLISGVLASYLWMDKTMKGGKINIWMYYFHRYLRLTPALATLALLHATIYKYLGYGPVFPTIDRLVVDGCQKYWWSTLLYIQNFVNPTNPCVPQSWYLSIDMQLHIFSPLLLIPLKRWPKLVFGIIFLLVGISSASTFVCVWYYELPATLYGFADDRDMNTFLDVYYYKTYTRMGSYFIGMLLGYIIYYKKNNSKSWNFGTVASFCMWCLVLSVMAVCIFAFQDTLIVNSRDILFNAYYSALSKPVWALCVSWVIYSCAFDIAGPIRKFLSSGPFQVLAKLSYSMYLTHYGIIFLKYVSLQEPYRYNIIDLFDRFWIFFAWSFISGIILCLTTESPIIATEKWLFTKPKEINSNHQCSEA